MASEVLGIKSDVEINYVERNLNEFSLNTKIIEISKSKNLGVNPERYDLIDESGKIYQLYFIKREGRAESMANAYEELVKTKSKCVQKHYLTQDNKLFTNDKAFLKEYTRGETLSTKIQEYRTWAINRANKLDQLDIQLNKLSKQYNLGVFDAYTLINMPENGRQELLKKLQEYDYKFNNDKRIRDVRESAIIELIGYELGNITKKTLKEENESFDYTNHISNTFVKNIYTKELSEILKNNSKLLSGKTAISFIDLKPANIVIGYDGNFYFIDLDSARRVDSNVTPLILNNFMTRLNTGISVKEFPRVQDYEKQLHAGTPKEKRIQILNELDKIRINNFAILYHDSLMMEYSNCLILKGYNNAIETENNEITKEASFLLTIRNFLADLSINENNSLYDLLTPFKESMMPNLTGPKKAHILKEEIHTSDGLFDLIVTPNDILLFNNIDNNIVSKKMIDYLITDKISYKQGNLNMSIGYDSKIPFKKEILTEIGKLLKTKKVIINGKETTVYDSMIELENQQSH